MHPGMVGAIVGSVLGLAGGIFGTYCSIRNTNGPRERSFMIRMSLVAWVAITFFLALMFVLPSPWNQVLWIPYGILLPLGIVHCNRRQAAIRAQESEGAGTVGAGSAMPQR